MPDDEGKRTAGAQRAVGLVELVNKVFANERIPSTLAAHAGYRVEMSGPEALSTSAPVGASSQLKLVPADAAESKEGDGGAATIVIGLVDPTLSQLELRTYEDLSKRHADKFKGDPLPIDTNAYTTLRTRIEQTLDRQGIETISSASRFDPTVRPEGALAPETKTPMTVWILVAVGALVAFAVIFFVTRK